ncbi:ABC transporter permease [Thiotrichales bacterium 19S3-7]|nr:ABC transporter permease [Thiotrichales bacterium 19S3-7]MCF6802013.1 ABC transporter permease [Thiotrichales bacterium 19S3-11]
MLKEKMLNTSDSTPASYEFNSEIKCLNLSGSWNWQNFDEHLLDQILKVIQSNNEINAITINSLSINKLDTIGATFLKLLFDRLEAANINILGLKFTQSQQNLFDLVKEKVKVSQPEKTKRINPKATAYFIGQQTFQTAKDFVNILAFLGAITLSTFQWVKIPFKTRIQLICEIVINDGYKATGIVCLLSFLIGIVLTYQMGVQLVTYGANIFVVNLLGLSIFREFAPLITAIIVAGRSGSAFAAHIGTMKVQEEIDALQTMGISPFKRLVSPRIIGLIIALTLLTVLADISSILGGMIMSKAYLHIGFTEFLTRFQEVIAAKNYILGLIKAPVFALLIAIVGCYRGFCVQGSASSIGQETTRSVVLSIFLIIVADAAFSILYSTLRI